MKHVRQLCLLILCSLMLSPLGAQTIDPEAYPGEKAQQQQEFLDGESAFPAKPRSKWSLGIKGGAAFVSGDVAAQPGFGAGIDFRRGLGHAVSLRVQATGGQAVGLNYQQSRGYRNHSGNPWSDLYYPGGVNGLDGSNSIPAVYYNFQMTYADVSVQAVFNLNNINFYKSDPKWGLHAMVGGGFLAFSTKIDGGRSANGVTEPYDFSSVSQTSLPGGGFLSVTGRRERIDALQNILDGEYETPAEGSATTTGITIGSNNFTTSPVIMAGLGASYKLNSRIDIELEHRFVWTNSDLLDGQRWQEVGFGGGQAYSSSVTPLTPDKDTYQQTTVGIHFRLGKGEEADWWRNPMRQVYNGIEESREVVRKLSEDSDNDGVPDLYDKEADTPEGMIVDASGVAQDSDGDGYPDSEDDEPFTPKGCDVDRNGKALDADNDGVPDCYDKEPNSEPGMYYDANGVAIQLPDYSEINNYGGNSPCLLPIIHFDLDRDNIKPDFYPELYYIAQVMKANESLKVRASGYTDSRNSDAYNQDLSQRRVDNAVNFIVNTYGIEASRFSTDAVGEQNPLIPNLPDNRVNPKLEPLHFVNRRVEFECIED